MRSKENECDDLELQMRIYEQRFSFDILHHSLTSKKQKKVWDRDEETYPFNQIFGKKDNYKMIHRIPRRRTIKRRETDRFHQTKFLSTWPSSTVSQHPDHLIEGLKVFLDDDDLMWMKTKSVSHVDETLDNLDRLRIDQLKSSECKSWWHDDEWAGFEMVNLIDLPLRRENWEWESDEKYRLEVNWVSWWTYHWSSHISEVGEWQVLRLGHDGMGWIGFGELNSKYLKLKFGHQFQ